MLSNTSLEPMPVGAIDLPLKRAADIVIAALALLCLCPLILAIGLLVRVTSPGPLLYRQKRVGRDGLLFDIYKFRTMCAGADRQGPSVTSADDSRVTPVGRFLRSKKLDEIPQLLNVIKGDMSLVGPRPQVPRFVDRFDPALRDVVLGVRPGITSPTTLYFRNEESMLANKADRETYYIEEILPVKLGMDAQYVRTRSLGGDMKVLAQTGMLFLGALSGQRMRPSPLLADSTAVL